MKAWMDRVQAVLNIRKKEQILVTVLIAAVLLLVVWPVPSAEKKTQKEDAAGESESTSELWQKEKDERKILEEELQGVLEQVEGVGAVEVVLTMESSGTRTVEKDIPTKDSSLVSSDNGQNSRQTEEQTEEQTVYQEQADGTKIPYVIRETMPEVRGVLVAAQGADDPEVVAEIKEAVMALFHLEAHKIKVMKKK